MALYRVAYTCEKPKCSGDRAILIYTDSKGKVCCKRHTNWALEEMTLPVNQYAKPMATLTVVLLYEMVKDTNLYYEEIRRAELLING
jgi:hypothetical protein